MILFELVGCIDIILVNLLILKIGKVCVICFFMFDVICCEL